MTAAKAETAEEFALRCVREVTLGTALLHELVRARDAAIFAPFKALAAKWITERLDYPTNTTEGVVAGAVVKLCAQELLACLPPEAEDSRKDEP